MRRLRNLWTHLTEPPIYWRLFSALAVILWLLTRGRRLRRRRRVFPTPCGTCPRIKPRDPHLLPRLLRGSAPSWL